MLTPPPPARAPKPAPEPEAKPDRPTIGLWKPSRPGDKDKDKDKDKPPQTEVASPFAPSLRKLSSWGV
jgi:hypothetical protein